MVADHQRGRHQGKQLIIVRITARQVTTSTE